MNRKPLKRTDPVGEHAGAEDLQFFEDVLKGSTSGAFEGASGRMRVETAGTGAAGMSYAGAMVRFVEIVAKRAALDAFPAGKTGRKASVPLVLGAQVFLERAAGELIAVALTLGAAASAVVIRPEVRGGMGLLQVELASTPIRLG